jgi:hypothetical protein
MSGRNTSIAISAIIALGIVGAATMAQAGDQNEERGGYVVPGSMVGVNPVYHPNWFGRAGNARAADEAYGYAPAGEAYGFAPIQKHHLVRERSRDR